MGKYIKKPIMIEAIQIEDGYENIQEIIEFSHSEVFIDVESNDYMVKTLEGNMIARTGDWLIKGVNGEFYPCKDDIFKKSYSKVVVRG